MGKNSLPPGFRFHPTDVELVKYYLKRKVLGKKLFFQGIVEVDIYKHSPWDLPHLSCSNTGDVKWYFYCPVEKKYGSGARINRATTYGYWKSTGKDRPVKYNEEVVGMKKTLVFHSGKAPRGDGTDWVMHEYRLEEKALADRGIVQGTYVLCVIFEKDGVGPKNAAQYGAPFKEEDWSDDEDINLPGTNSPSDMPMIAVNGASCSCVTENLRGGPSIETNGLNTLPLVLNTNGTVGITTEIDHSYAYTASKCLDAPQVSVFADLEAPHVPLIAASEGTQVPVVGDPKTDPALEGPLLGQVPQVIESYDDGILSWMEIFTEDDASITHVVMGQMTSNIAKDSFFWSPQVSNDDDGGILSILESFTEDNNLSYPFG